MKIPPFAFGPESEDITSATITVASKSVSAQG